MVVVVVSVLLFVHGHADVFVYVFECLNGHLYI